MIEEEKIFLSHMIKFYMKTSELDWIEGQETVVTYLHEKGNRPENIDGSQLQANVGVQA
jgi:hypothetical protein